MRQMCTNGRQFSQKGLELQISTWNAYYYVELMIFLDRVVHSWTVRFSEWKFSLNGSLYILCELSTYFQNTKPSPDILGQEIERF